MSEHIPPINELNDRLDQILPVGPLVHASDEAPPMAEFKPWHLPRKQHVRKEQWGVALARLIDELPQHRHMINYLCLPGEDLMDVQVLAGICKAKGRRLKYLGFDQTQANPVRSIQRVAAEQILRQTDVVEATSEVIPDGFASISHQDSFGSRQLRNNGSYDIVNLDMCDAFTTHPHAHNHDAVLQLLNHQSHCRGEPWLLFLTTRAEIDRLQPEELLAYDSRIHENIQNSLEFRECLSRILELAPAVSHDVLLAQLQQIRNRNIGISGRWLTIAIGKWLLGIMGQRAPWRVDLLSVCCYRTGLMTGRGVQYAGEPPNLFSLAFRLDKIRQNRNDPAGLATPPQIADGEFNERHLAHKMASCVERYTLDLDSYLQEHGNVHDQLKGECEALLSVRYYSPHAYRNWITGLPRIAG